ncbi:MAG: ParA family protein [Gammaproteobacteria bacterium]|nr:ParA family protein [Gammaproteobacteria bacterium]
MRRIAIINQKGGVGKTTTAANLSHALALTGASVQTLDMDPQGHLAAHLGYHDPSIKGLGEILLGQAPRREWNLEARENLRLIPAGVNLKTIELKPFDTEIRDRFQRYLAQDVQESDYLIVDCPPASGVLILYALSIVDEIIIPVAGDYLALRGLSDLMSTLKGYSQQVGRGFQFYIVCTRYHQRRRLCWEVKKKLLEYFPNRVFDTHIRETSVLAECPSFGCTSFEYKKGSFGGEDYSRLAMDLIEGRFAS